MLYRIDEIKERIKNKSKVGFILVKKNGKRWRHSRRESLTEGEVKVRGGSRGDQTVWEKVEGRAGGSRTGGIVNRS